MQSILYCISLDAVKSCYDVTDSNNSRLVRGVSEGDAKKEKRNMEIEGLVTERKSNSKQQSRTKKKNQ